MREIPPQTVYWLLSTCEGCGRRVRASHVLRFWKERETPTTDDAEMMVTRSGGHRQLRNERGDLWPQLAAMTDSRKRFELGRIVAEYFDQLEKRLLAAARVARDAAYRARYGR